MWDSSKQRLLDDLRTLAESGPLPAGPSRELEHLIHELEQVEEARLRPAIDRVRHEQAGLRSVLSHVHAQNSALLALADRYDDLLARAKAQLAGLENERQVLREELVRALQ